MLTDFRFLSQREAYEKGVVSGMTVGEMSRFMECTKPISYLNKDEHALEKLISAMLSTCSRIFPLRLYCILHVDTYLETKSSVFSLFFFLHINPDFSQVTKKKLFVEVFKNLAI